MKLRLPHRLQAALVAALASVSFTTLSSGTLSAAFFFGSQAFAEEAADEPTATIDIGDTNLDAQAAIDEEEGKGEAKEPGSAPINQAGFNGIRGSSDDADQAVATEVIAESSIDTENVGTADQANYTGTSADLPSDDLGFTSNTYASGSDTSNGSVVDSPVTSFTQASQIASAGGYSAAGTGSGSNSASPVSVFGNTGSGATGGGSFGSGISLGSVTKAAPTPVVLGAVTSTVSSPTAENAAGWFAYDATTEQWTYSSNYSANSAVTLGSSFSFKDGDGNKISFNVGKRSTYTFAFTVDLAKLDSGTAEILLTAGSGSNTSSYNTGIGLSADRKLTETWNGTVAYSGTTFATLGVTGLVTIVHTAGSNGGYLYAITPDGKTVVQGKNGWSTLKGSYSIQDFIMSDNLKDAIVTFGVWQADGTWNNADTLKQAALALNNIPPSDALVWAGTSTDHTWTNDSSTPWQGGTFSSGSDVTFSSLAANKEVLVQSAITAGTMTVSDDYTFKTNSNGSLTASALSLKDGADVVLYAENQNRVFNLGDVDVEGTASIMNRWFNATQNINSIAGGATDTLALISNDCADTATWNIGQSEATNRFSGKLVLQAQDTDGSAKNRTVNFNIKNSDMLSGATIETKNGPVTNVGSGMTMTNNINLGVSEVKFGGINDGGTDSTARRNNVWTIKPTSGTSTLILDGTGTYRTTSAVAANVNINKTGAGTQTFGGDMSNFSGTIEVGAGTLALTSAVGNASTVSVTGGTLNLGAALTTTGEVTVSSGATLKLASGNLLTSGGDLTLAGASLNLSGMNFTTGQTVTLATSNTGNIDYSGMSVTLSPKYSNDYTLNQTGNSLTLTYNGAEPASNTLHIYLLTGQSNSLGCVKGDPASSAMLAEYAPKTTQMWDGNMSGSIDDPSVDTKNKAWQDEGKDWFLVQQQYAPTGKDVAGPSDTPYANMKGNGNLTSAWGGSVVMGTEYGFSYMSEKQGWNIGDASDIAIIKVSRDGGDNDFWNPDASKSICPQMLDTIIKAVKSVDATQYTDISLDGLLFLQGETGTAAQGANAKNVLNSMITYLQNGLNAAMQAGGVLEDYAGMFTVSVGDTIILGEPAGPGRASTKPSAQVYKQWAGEDPDQVGFVYTQDLGLYTDNLHYDGNSQITIGARYAYAMAQVQGLDTTQNGTVRVRSQAYGDSMLAESTVNLNDAAAWWKSIGDTSQFVDISSLANTVAVWDVSSANMAKFSGEQITADLALGGIRIEDPYSNDENPGDHKATISINNASGTHTLSVGAAGITLQQGNLTVNTNLTATASQTWNTAAGQQNTLNLTGTTTIADGATVTIEGASIVNISTLAGTGGLTVNGAGAVVTLTDKTAFTGTTTITSGTLKSTGTDDLDITGNLTINGGSATFAGNITADTITLSNIATSGSQGTFDKYAGVITGSDTITLDHYTVANMAASLVTRTLVATNSTDTTIHNLRLTACEIKVESGSNVTLADSLTLGDSATYTGTLNLADGLTIDVSNMTLGGAGSSVALLSTENGNLGDTDISKLSVNFGSGSPAPEYSLSMSGNNLMLTLGEVQEVLIWDNHDSNTKWNTTSLNWHKDGEHEGSSLFKQNDNVRFTTATNDQNISLDGNTQVGTIQVDENVTIAVSGKGKQFDIAEITGGNNSTFTLYNAPDKQINIHGDANVGTLRIGGSTTTFDGGDNTLGKVQMINNGGNKTILKFAAKTGQAEGELSTYTFDTIQTLDSNVTRWIIVDSGVKVIGTGNTLPEHATIAIAYGMSGGGLTVNGELDLAGIISMDSGNNQSYIQGSGQINTTGLNISNQNTTTIQGGVKVNITSDTGIYKRAVSSTLNLADATLQAKEASWELKSNMGTVNLTNAFTGTTFQADDGYTITVSKAMGGAGKLVKTGDGTLTLNTANAYSGGTEVNAGTLAVSNASGLGSGAVTLNSGMLDLSTAVTAGALTMSGGTLALDGSNWYTATTGNISLTGGTLDLTGFDLSSGAESYTLATATNGTVSTSGVTLALGTGYDPSLYSLGVQGNNLVLTFTQPAPTEDLIWHGGNGNWSSNNWHTETAPETRVPFADGLSVTFESGASEVTLTQDVTAPTTTLESGAVVKVVSEQGGNYTLNTTLKGAGTFVLAAGATTLPSEVTLSSTDWRGVVRINGTFTGLDIATLGNNIASTIEFAGVEGYFKNPENNTISLSRDVIFSNAGSRNAAIYISDGYSKNGGYEFAGNVSGTGTFQLACNPTQHFTFSGDVSAWDGEIKVTNCGSGNDGSWVKFTGSATEVKAAINQTGGTFRVIADANTTFKDDINVQRLEVTTDHTATLEGDVTLTGSQGITGSGAVNVAQGGTLTFASGVDTISGTLTVSDGATLKLSEMNDAAITTSGTLTLNSGSTLDLSSLTSITGRELTPITLVQQVQGGTITDTYLGGVNLVFARGVTGGKLSVQNSALVLTFIEPGKTLIWDNHAGNQTWSKGVDDANWHTPNNPSRHIEFEEYDIVQFNGGGATSVFMAEDVTPARMEVASGKTLKIYTEGHDLTIVQDLSASGASVVLDSEGKQGQATSVGGDAVARNLQIVGGSVDVRGYLDVENKATVTSDASLTAEHASNIGTLQVMGGTVDLKGKASVNRVELVGGMSYGSTSRATFESDSFVNALSVNSSELVNKGIMEMQNGAVMLSGTSSITGVGSINTASVRVVSGTTTIDGGQTINVTSANGITGTGTLNLGNATLTANTRSWILANTVGVTLTDGDNGAKLSATDYTLTVASNITGTGKLVKTGTGTVELTGSNSYTGGTEVNAGTLLISSAAALTGDVNVANGGRLRISDALVSSASAPSVNNLTVAQGGTLRLAGENALAVTGTLTMAAGSTLDLSHINIVDNKTTYTLASGGTFDVDAAVILTFGQGIHPKQGTTPSLTVEGDQGRQTLVLNYELNTPKNLIWDGGTANWNDDMTNWHAKEGSAGSSTFATYDNVIFDGTDIAGRGGDDTPTLSENVYATNMTVTKDNDVTVNTNGHRLDVDFLHAAEGSTITKTGTGTAFIGIADNGFGADLTVTGGTLTAEYVDMNGAGMEVTGNLAADGGTLNVIIGRPETPTNIEFTSDSSVIALSSILVDENSTAVFNGAVSVPQNVTVEVRDGAELVFGGNTNMSANRWLMTGEGSVHFTGPVTLSEDTNNYEKIDGKLTVTFDDLTQGKANLTLRMQEGTDTNIGTLHLKGVQRCFYLTFQYDEQERGLLEIDTLDVAADGATHGIGSLCSRFGELQGYQQQGSISIAQLTGGGTVSLFNYAYDNNNASGRIGYDSPEVFYVGGKSVENKLFSGNIQLADGGFGVSEANKLKPKHTVLVLEDEIVASQSVIQINNADTGAGDNRNNGKYSNFGIGIDADNVKVQGIEDVALQSGNQVKIFSGSVGTETNASYGSDDIVRTLQLTGKTTDTAGTTYRSSAGFDKNVDIVKQGAGTQVFSGDSSKFNASIEIQDGVLEFLNTASLHIEDLTLGKDKVQQPALMKSAPLKALGSDAANVDTLAVRSDAAGENVGMAEVNGTLKAKSGAALDSNLTLASGSTLDVRDTLTTQQGEFADKTDYVGGLDMLRNTLTLQSGAYLSNKDRSALLSMQWGERYELAYNVDSLTLGDFTTEESFGYEQGSANNIEASQYFQNLQEDDYYLCYSGANGVGPNGTNVGVFYIFKAPEPTTSTLSLLALAALAARRRRK